MVRPSTPYFAAFSEACTGSTGRGDNYCDHDGRGKSTNCQEMPFLEDLRTSNDGRCSIGPTLSLS